MSVNIPQLTIEMEEDGTVLLEQEWCGETDRIQLHPIHIRHLAELAGLLEPLKRQAQAASPAAAPPLSEAETNALAETYFAAP